MSAHYYDIQTKRAKVRAGATLNDLFPGHDEIIPDTGNRYRYACTCGKSGRWFRDGNMAKMQGESHTGTE